MANFDLKRVMRGRFAIASNAQFQTDLTTDVATNFFDLRHKPFRMGRDTITTKDETVRQTMFDSKDDVRGPDRGSIQLASYWTGTNQALDATTPPTKRAQSKIFEALLGGYYAAQGSALTGVPTTTTGSVTAGHGTRFKEGQLAGITIGGVVYPVLITSVVVDALQWWPALPSAPSAAAVVLNGQNIYLADRPDKSIQVLAEDAISRRNIWLGMGGQGDLTFKLDRNGNAEWGSKLTFAKYLHDDAIAVPQTGNPIAAASYDDTGPVIVSEGGLHLGPTASTARSLIRGSVAINLDRKWLDIGDFGAVTTDGQGQWHTDIPDMTAEITTPWLDDTYDDAFQAGTHYGMLFWLQGTGGQIRALCCPDMQLIKAPDNGGDYQGVDAIKLTFGIRKNSLSATANNEQSRSPVIIAGL